MTRRHEVPRWFTLLLTGLSTAALLITAALPSNTVSAAQKQSPGWLIIRVVDQSGKPVDAIVVIKGAQNRAGRTDAQGRYVVAIPPGRYLVSAVYAGQATTSRGVTVLPGGTRQTTIALSVTGRPTSPVAGVPNVPTPSRSGAITAQAGGTSGQTSGAPAPSTNAGSGSAPVSGPAGSVNPSRSAEPADGTPSAAVESALAGSGGSTHSQGSQPAKINKMKASPSVTQPGGSSTISADLSNPDNLVLTYSWQASGGTISAANLQALWVAPQAIGQFTVALTIKDTKGRTSTGTVAVYSQPVIAPARIAGQVTDTVGVAIVGATVTGSGPTVWSVVTDLNGNYVSPDLTAGSYVVVAYSIGYDSQTVTSDPPSGSTTIVNFALAGALPIGTNVQDGFRYAGYYKSDFTIPLSTLAANYDLVTLNPSEGLSAVYTLTNQLKALNPKIRILWYWYPTAYASWFPDWATVSAHESWFLHNPDGSTSSADRVRYTEYGSITRYVMNINNGSFRSYLINYLKQIAGPYPVNGFFFDGPVALGTLRLGLGGGARPWVRSPTTNQMNSWHGWARDLWLADVSAQLRSAGYEIITNSTWWTYNEDVDPDSNDTDLLPRIDGTMLEGFAHAYWQTNSEYLNLFTYQKGKASRNIAAGKKFIALSGLTWNGETQAQKDRWRNFCVASWLMTADGAKSYFEWNREWATAFNTMTIGLPLGAAYQQNGVWRRDFTGGYARVNPSPSLTIGGLGPAMGEIVLR